MSMLTGGRRSTGLALPNLAEEQVADFAECSLLVHGRVFVYSIRASATDRNRTS
jgi:hypothetical protein